MNNQLSNQIEQSRTKESDQDSDVIANLQGAVTLLKARIDAMEKRFSERQEHLQSLSLLLPLARVSYTFSELIQVTSVVRLHKKAVLCIKAMSEVQTPIPLGTPLNKSLFNVKITSHDLAFSGREIISTQEVPFRYLTQREAEAEGLDVHSPPLSEAHFIITFILDKPVTYKIGVYRPLSSMTTQRQELEIKSHVAQTGSSTFGEAPLPTIKHQKDEVFASPSPGHRPISSYPATSPQASVFSSFSTPPASMLKAQTEGDFAVPSTGSTSYAIPDRVSSSSPFSVTSPTISAQSFSMVPSHSSSAYPVSSSPMVSSMMSSSFKHAPLFSAPSPSPPSFQSYSTVVSAVPSHVPLSISPMPTSVLGSTTPPLLPPLQSASPYSSISGSSTGNDAPIDVLGRTPAPSYMSGTPFVTTLSSSLVQSGQIGSVASSISSSGLNPPSQSSISGVRGRHLTTLHIPTSPIFIRYAFAFNEKKSAAGLAVSDHGLCLSYERDAVGRRMGVTDEVMEGSSFFWRMRIKHLAPSTPMLLGIVDESLWMPGQTLTSLKGAVVVDVQDLSVFVNGEQQRIFARQEKYQLKEGSCIDFYLDCKDEKLYISLDEMPAKEIKEITPFPQKWIAAAELYSHGDAVQLEFPYPRIVIDHSDDEDQEERIWREQAELVYMQNPPLSVPEPTWTSDKQFEETPKKIETPGNEEEETEDDDCNPKPVQI
ncbi:uncharacterized protein MONOS_8200 [Monocercomonoides exilis]|uniref:uncharacterized protein n=1 Tax=Monocercomonoides exilis TaxID=2049356 RepID=UPI00355A75FD|nr:hypothetical protein MONOS_8200 [Monocercomonoides exilis]|eukprot:MONOS_8200.1-p1 / transcript=MONOS_8200.1 / gene=MONOS_8200 / organism=Monocercomonoides_exilis_PA203 / gene_product=unspecified product / transcript_product=unspecified product / location=Mono_scaffold00302:60129-62347(+) / protein_length=710 / sequence_SO=supercontig / SO=protein_coding / is_pseudo=false